MFRELLRLEFQPWGNLSELQLRQLELHYQLLAAWNMRLNLTRIEDISEVVRFHYCESLYVSTVLPTNALTVGDLGSGAGFPGIPLAVIRPDIKVTLIESDQRKAVFLREVTRRLPNVQVLAGRFQDCSIRFDWGVARAVAVEEILACRVSPNLALLLGSKDVPGGTEVVKLPWGRDRVLAVSRRNDVSRGT